jgi:hypothetical protein
MTGMYRVLTPRGGSGQAPVRYRYVSSSPLANSDLLSSIPPSFVQDIIAMPSSAFILRAGIALVSLTTTFLEASAQTVTPVGLWKPLSTSCPAGGDPSANGGLGGGGYVDKWGGRWDARCGQTLSGAVFEGGVATGSQGWYGCAKGCAKRPKCTAFHFVANSNLPASSWNEKAGSGLCYFRVDAGIYLTDNTIYGATHLIRANNQLPVSQCNML